MKNLQSYFLKIFFENTQTKEIVKNLVFFGILIMMPTSNFDYYDY